MTRRRRIQGREVHWAKHDLAFWEERALTRKLPKPLRVAAFAYANITPNGHVNTSSADIQAILVDTKSGEIPARETVSKAVRAAVQFGLLAEGSTTACLIAPEGIRVDVGTPAARHAKCLVCG